MKKISLVLILLVSGCSTLKPVKRCLDTVDRDSQQRTEYSLCKTLWIWE